MIGSHRDGEPRWTAPPVTAAPACRRGGRRRRRRSADDRRGADEAHRPLRRRQPEPIDELGLLVRPQEQVDGREAPVQPLPVHLAHGAAGHDDAHRGVGGLELRQLALAPDDLRLGGLADRAGVDDHEARGIHRRRLREARGEQAPGHLLGIAAVHLAAERPHEEARERARFGPELAEPEVVRVGGGARRGRRWRRDLEHR
jgi:hypothetical protein